MHMDEQLISTVSGALLAGARSSSSSTALIGTVALAFAFLVAFRSNRFPAASMSMRSLSSGDVTGSSRSAIETYFCRPGFAPLAFLPSFFLAAAFDLGLASLSSHSLTLAAPLAGMS